jgi:hypothetical protein
MAQRDPHADPYIDSGRSAAGHTLIHMKIEALKNSIQDAAQLHDRGVMLVARCDRRRLLPWAVLTLTPAGVVALGMVAVSSFDGTYDGAMAGTWSMLGVTLCLSAALLALAWLSAIKQIGETGQRLQRRAEYQRRMGLLHLAELTGKEPDETLR